MRARSFYGAVLAGVLGLTLAGCAADELDSDDWDESFDTEEIAVSGRWIPPREATAAGDRQSVRYDNPPSWNSGRNCGGGILAGARELGDYVRASFRSQTTGYDGYVCRQNTANTSQTSVHGTGRAIDIYIPTTGGQADNTKGDPIANWLIANASALGVQLVIWDRSSWNGSRAAGSKLRAYGGPHPHHDHIHVELNTDGAARRTAWFRDPSAVSAPPTSTPPSATTTTPPSTSTSASAQRVRVNTGALNLRRGPGTSYAIVTSMPCGAAATVVSGPSGGWYQLDYGSARGWASGSYLRSEASFSDSVCR